jgi:hypothetical protein
MFLKRVQVPDFRALKNVDISFEPQFRPRVFPLGSQNGGGKSTLLQLIFVLLHCSWDWQRFPLVRNLLHGLEIPKAQYNLATIEIIDDQQQAITLEFTCCTPSDYTDLFGEIERSIETKKKIKEMVESTAPNLIGTQEYEQEMLPYYRDLLLDKAIFTIGRVVSEQQHWNIEKDFYVLCHIEGIIGETAILESLKTISDKIFLAAPSTQIFLFLPIISRQGLFKSGSSLGEESYYELLQRTRSTVPNLSTYDFFLVDLLIASFKLARDQDFRQKAETGQYGNAYDRLLEKINLFLGNKKIRVEGDLSGIRFLTEKDGRRVDLLPEDLSHGELKRLSIYMWLEYAQISDAIVLMDEIEIALHPDWQYHIVGDLVEWGPTNQYILATHSYELCQALPPAHVKEIEPNLLPQAQPA